MELLIHKYKYFDWGGGGSEAKEPPTVTENALDHQTQPYVFQWSNTHS